MITRPIRLVLAAAFALAAAPLAAGQLEDRVRAVLAPPATIFDHAEDLRLTLAQRTNLIQMTTQAEAKIRRLEADLLDATAALVKALEAQPIDRAAASAQLAKVNTAEAEIKRIHLDLWIAANAELTTAQRRRALEWSKNGTGTVNPD